MKNKITPIAKIILTSLGLTAAAAADVGIHKKIRFWNKNTDNIK